jgi:hypothetical protein
MHRFLPSHCDECASCTLFRVCNCNEQKHATHYISVGDNALLVWLSRIEAKISPSTSRVFNSSRFPPVLFSDVMAYIKFFLTLKRQQMTTTTKGIFPSSFAQYGVLYVWKKEGKCPSYRQSRVERKYSERMRKEPCAISLLNFDRSILEFHM